MRDRLRSVRRGAAYGFGVIVCGLLCASVTPAQKPQPKELNEVAEQSPASWKEFLSKEGGFAIKFPGVPKEESQPIGEFTLRIHRLQTFAEYSVMYADYPEWVSDKDPRLAKKVLDSGLEGAVAETKSQLLEVEEISLQNHPGRRYTERMPDGSVLRGKTFLVGHRIYQIAITTPKEDGVISDTIKFYHATASKFLESFRLLEP